MSFSSALLLLQLLYLIFATLHCVVISDETVQYALQEQVAIGTRVGNVIVSSGIRKLYQKHEIQLLEFRFLADPPIPLTIGTSDGVIRTSGVIDRDVMSWCRQSDICEVNLDVTVQPVDYFRIIKVTISIIDINDNPPRFSETQSLMAILESASVGSTFLLPSATDADSPSFGVHRYELQTYSSKFGVKVTPKLDGFLDVRLLLRERLDREVHDEYRMTLIAYDGGDPAKSDSLNVTVRILDSNDNDPVFDQQNYDISVVENTRRNVTIGTVGARDADVGVNGHVVYGFTLQTHALYGHVFAIDNATGAITLKREVDRELVSAYQLIVTAEDQGPDSHPVDVTVLVSVEDTNDNRPEITVNTLAAVGSDWASVPENTPVGTFVAHVTVFDPDAGQNGTVSCSLEDEYFSLVKRSLVQQSETEYQILTARSLDREMIGAFNISLHCVDHGSPEQRSVKSLLVNVLDENDNSPFFSQDAYRVSIYENNQKGQSVVQLNATDDDDGDNGRIHFVVVGPLSLAFAVSTRGLVTAKHVIDREEDDFYRFNVLAVDGGNPPRSGSTLVVISVKDINDESPLFTQSSYSFSVRENENPGTFVGETSAFDRDLEPFNVVQYTFLQENQATDCFFIDSVNGTITTRCRLDREDQPIYHLAVAAVDRAASPPLTSSASLVIYVEDDNDNAPVFEFPSLSNNTLHVSNRVPLGLVLTTLQARDRDEDLNSKISFRLQSGNDDGMFHLDPILGSVFVNRVLFDINHHVYRLHVVAEDHGHPQQLTSAHLNIVVNRSIPFLDASSSMDVLPHPVVIVVVVVGSACLLLVVALVLWLMIIRPRNSHSLQHPLEKAASCRPEGLRMLQATRDNGGGGGGGGSSAEGTPIKRPLVLHSAATATNNNFDHLHRQERKSFSSADGFYGDGYHGNSNDDDNDATASPAHHRTSLRSSLPVTSSNIWPLPSAGGRGPSPGYSTYDKHFTPSSRLHTLTLPQPPRLREPEPVWAPISPQPNDLHPTGNGAGLTSSAVARQPLPPGCRSNCFHRAEPANTNSFGGQHQLQQQSQHTLPV